MDKLILFLATGIFCLNFVCAFGYGDTTGYGYNNAKGAQIVSGANYSINVNNSNCWLGHCTSDGSWLTGISGGNPFDQSLNTTDVVSFAGLSSLSGTLPVTTTLDGQNSYNLNNWASASFNSGGASVGINTGGGTLSVTNGFAYFAASGYYTYINYLDALDAHDGNGNVVVLANGTYAIDATGDMLLNGNLSGTNNICLSDGTNCLPSSGGNPFDQSLNTTDNVTFNNLNLTGDIGITFPATNSPRDYFINLDNNNNTDGNNLFIQGSRSISNGNGGNVEIDAGDSDSPDAIGGTLRLNAGANNNNGTGGDVLLGAGDHSLPGGSDGNVGIINPSQGAIAYFDVNSLTTAVKRYFTFPDKSGTFALTSDICYSNGTNCNITLSTYNATYDKWAYNQTFNSTGYAQYQFTNNNFNGTGNITTTQYGFFGWLGSVTNAITKIWASNIDVGSGTISNVTTLNMTVAGNGVINMFTGNITNATAISFNCLGNVALNLTLNNTMQCNLTGYYYT